jgi:abelson tyrosine-protein kinase 1
MYNYLDNLDAPKKWLKAHCDTILKVYGEQYALQREDVMLGTNLH